MGANNFTITNKLFNKSYEIKVPMRGSRSVNFCTVFAIFVGE